MEREISKTEASQPSILSGEEISGFFRDPEYVAMASSGPDAASGFNVWAAVFGAYWCVYRKLFIPAAVYLLVIDATLLAAILITDQPHTASPNREYAMLAIFLVFRLILGKAANNVYITRGITKIQSIKAKYAGNPDATIKAIRLAGGTSPTAVAVLCFCSSAINLLAR